MKLSVIIPAYNEASSLPATLGAILAQDYPDYEVIVVDNASTDKTFETAVSFPGVTVVREMNKGTLWARERGRREAKGEILVFMDADCLPEKDWLAKGSARFSDSRISAVSGPYDYYDAKPFFRKFSLGFQQTVYVFFNWLMQALKKGAVTIGGNTFMRATAMASAGGFDTSFTFYGDDTDTAMKLAHFGRVIFDPRLSIKSASRRFKKDGILKLQAKYTYHFFRTIFGGSQKQV